MVFDDSYPLDDPLKNVWKCDHCGKIITENYYTLNRKKLCEDCCIAARTTYQRKSHWQYIRSVKEDYLQPAKKKTNLKQRF